jgi:signal transduction histidine kinase
MPKHEPLLSSVCHDLRAPLAAIQMGASFVLQTTPDAPSNARARKILEAVLRSCGQMGRLLENFSDVSHLEDGNVTLDPVVQDARRAAEVAAASMADLAKAREVEVALALPAEPVPVTADRERLARAVAHLVDNAIRHGPPHATVRVEVVPRPDVVAFVVTDHGEGPAPEARAHLFERAWHSTRAGRSGAGLGLAIARGFAELHGGTVRLEPSTDAPSRFVLEVPRAPANASSACVD